MDVIQQINIEIKGLVVEDVAEKVGAIFGEDSKRIGKLIERLTKNITIKIGEEEDEQSNK